LDSHGTKALFIIFGILKTASGTRDIENRYIKITTKVYPMCIAYNYCIFGVLCPWRPMP